MHKTNTTKGIRTSKQIRSTSQKQPRALKAAKTLSDKNHQRTLKRAIPKLPECEISVEDLDQQYIKILKEELLKEFVNTSFSKFIDRHQAARHAGLRLSLILRLSLSLSLRLRLKSTP